MQLLVVNLFLFFIFLVLNVYVFDVSLNVSPASSSSSSSSISLSSPRKSPSASRITYTKVSYIYVTLDLIRIISILFLCAIYLLSGIICIKVRFINFRSNTLSVKISSVEMFRRWKCFVGGNFSSVEISSLHQIFVIFHRRKCLRESLVYYSRFTPRT